VKSISLQILQRDLKQLPHHYASSVRRCRKPSIFITINPSSCDSHLRHFPCSTSVCHDQSIRACADNLALRIARTGTV
jgi:hypothetical protein